MLNVERTREQKAAHIGLSRARLRWVWASAVLFATARSSWALAGDVAVPVGPLALPVNRWTKIAAAAPDPLGRELEPGRGAYWAFDPAGGLFWRYGGYTPTEGNDLWSFDLLQRKWENPLPADYAWPPPQDRPGAGAWWSAAYDTKRKVFWLFGGYGIAIRKQKALYKDVWQFDPAKRVFSAMQAQKPPVETFAELDGPRIVYDAKHDLLVRAPAYSAEWTYKDNKDKTWVYDPTKNEWQARETPGSPAPRACLAAVFVYDTGTGKCVYLANGPDGAAETWLYDTASNTWEKLTGAEQPRGRVCAGAAYDAGNRVVIAYGGIGGAPKAGSYGYLYRYGGTQLHDTWALDLAKREWKRLDVGAPELEKLPGEATRHTGLARFELVQALDYDSKRKALVLSAPTLGVWALRYQPPGAEALPELKLAALPPAGKPRSPERVFPQAPPNKKLLDLEEQTWLKLEGGGKLGGDEVPWTYDEATGFALKYGGCGNYATTFASGYCQDLSAYDPATERWIALRWSDPCGPPRPGLGCSRWYAYDPILKLTWFQGANAPSHSPYTLPRGAADVPGMFSYDGLRDRFEFVPTQGGEYGGNRQGSGIIGCFDRHLQLFLISSRTYKDGVLAFHTGNRKWELLDPKAPPVAGYIGASYVESLKALVVPHGGKDGFKTMAFDATARAWRDLGAKGDLPADVWNERSRPATAYDPDHDILLLVGVVKVEGEQRHAKTYAYLVKENTWKLLATKTPTPPIGERLVFDRRHKVFLGHAGEVHAFRYRK